MLTVSGKQAKCVLRNRDDEGYTSVTLGLAPVRDGTHPRYAGDGRFRSVDLKLVRPSGVLRSEDPYDSRVEGKIPYTAESLSIVDIRRCARVGAASSVL